MVPSIWYPEPIINERPLNRFEGRAWATTNQRTTTLTPGKARPFLTKDLDLIKKQLYDGLDLRMEDLTVEDLLDDINTDVMTPAWVCFDHDPAEIAKNAYAGLMHNGLRVFRENALKDGNTRVSCQDSEKEPGPVEKLQPSANVEMNISIVIAASFAPIHERNNINLGQLMGGRRNAQAPAER